jgi:putative transposase
MFVLCEKVFKAILEKNGCVLYEFNGESDHMHLLVGVRPTNSVSVLVNSLKGVSARMLNKEFKELSKVFYGKNIGIWSRAYYVSSVGGVSLDTLKKYIREQNHPL